MRKKTLKNFSTTYKMVNYLASKIYTIRCRDDDTLIYVGSTTRRLTDRFSCHKNNKGITSLKKHIRDNFNGDWSNWYIELHEEFPCRNKEELNKREGEVIREIATINKNIAGRTLKEWRFDNKDKVMEINKKYYANNADKIIGQQKKYYADNTCKILEQKKKYYADNADKIADYKKQYYLQNREAIRKRQNEYNRQKKMNDFQETDISVN